MNLKSNRVQLFLAAVLIIIVGGGLLFYFLSGASNRLTETTSGLPTNPEAILNDDGTFNDFENNSSLDLSPDTQQLLNKVSNNPVSGYAIIKDQNGVSIRYQESQTGHIYEYFPGDQNGGNRLTNTTFQRIVRSTFLSPDDVLIQYDQDGVEVNFLARIDVASGVLDGQIFPSRLISITSNKVETAYYLTKADDGGSVVNKYDLDNDQNVVIGELPIQALDLKYHDGELFAVSRPTNPASNQLLFRISTTTGDYDFVPTANSARAGIVFGSDSRLLLGQNQSFINKFDNSGDFPMNVISNSDKCSFSSEDNVFICAQANNLNPQNRRSWPFNWFMGQVRPSESLVEINPDFGDLFVLTDLGNQYDVDFLKVYRDRVYFISRTDGQLYEYFRGVSF